jgi:hypothetical protein
VLAAERSLDQEKGQALPIDDSLVIEEGQGREQNSKEGLQAAHESFSYYCMRP